MKEFKEATNNNTDLVECLSDNKSPEKQVNNWYKHLKSIIHNTFEKVRITNNRSIESPTEIESMINTIRKLKKDVNMIEDVEQKQIIENEIEELDKKISDECAKENSEIIKNHTRNVCTIEGTFSSNAMWKLKKKIFKKAYELPTAKKNAEGMLITNPEMIRNMYVQTYQERLAHKNIKPYLSNLEMIKDELFTLRMSKSILSKSKDWTIKI